ncbi:hypothetical protein GZH53_08975 [Flavihumibacter sp. R14]|nr:hypothetical protein [Flavihumibacter soli]
MSFKNYLGLFGAILVIAGGMSPMLRIPVIGNWNYLDIDTVLASIVFVLAATGLLGAVMRKPGLVRFSGWGVLVVVLFTLVAVYFKVNDYFSFIPFRKLASLASNMVHYKWMGWAMLFSGAFLMIGSGAGLRKTKTY